MKAEGENRRSVGDLSRDEDHPDVSSLDDAIHVGDDEANLSGVATNSKTDNDDSLVTVPKGSATKSQTKLRKGSSKKKNEGNTNADTATPTKIKSKSPVKESDGVVIGNFHAFETDDQTEVLIPQLVNGCSRVLVLGPEHQIAVANSNGGSGGDRRSGGNNTSSIAANNNHSTSLTKVVSDYSKDTSCGVAGLCLFLQPLATRGSFLVIFCLTTVLQGMFYTYFASGLSTIQKLYRISSQVTGIIMSATEVGQICGSMFLAYYGGSGHRPRWIAWGMLIFALCTFLCAVPHFLFSIDEPQTVVVDTDTQENFNTCNAVDAVSSLVSINALEILNGTGHRGPLPSVDASSEPCQDPSRYTNFVLALFFLALIGVGIGQTAVVNLGIPYIDDNVDNKDSPMYFATTSAVRILGPTLGFVLGSVCTRLYVHPLQHPGFGTSDPRWVGAWWLGHIIVSALLLLATVAMFLFPRRLPPSGRNRPRAPLPMEEGGGPPFPASTTITSIVSSLEPTSPAPDGKVRTNMSALLHTQSVVNSRQPSLLNMTEELQELAPHTAVPVGRRAAPKHGTEHRYCPVGERRGGDDTEDFPGPSAPMLEGRAGGQYGHMDAEDGWDEECYEKPKLKDFPGAVRRQLRNPVLVLRTASSVLHILPIAGLYTFLPKYLETQFRLPVHTAAMFAGIGGILLMGVGIVVSGVFIRYTRPSARAIAAWIALTALLYSIGMVILMFIGCEQDDFVSFVRTTESSAPVFVPPCNRSCAGSCDETLFAPVCTAGGDTHFSACHLGCAAVNTTKGGEGALGGTVQFLECECLPTGESVELRLCDLACDSIVWYISIFAVLVIIYSTAEVGGMLITLRCCRKHDKAMALGLISLAIGLFGNMPCPIIYGGIVDAACIQWRTTCGTVGDCQLYDTRFFRFVFHGITAGIMLLAFFVDVAVWFKCKHIILQPDAVEEGGESNFNDFAAVDEARSRSSNSRPQQLMVSAPTLDSSKGLSLSTTRTLADNSLSRDDAKKATETSPSKTSGACATPAPSLSPQASSSLTSTSESGSSERKRQALGEKKVRTRHPPQKREADARESGNGEPKESGNGEPKESVRKSRSERTRTSPQKSTGPMSSGNCEDCVKGPDKQSRQSTVIGGSDGAEQVADNSGDGSLCESGRTSRVYKSTAL